MENTDENNRPGGRGGIIGRPWRKGESGNPNGRPKGPSILKLVKLKLKEECKHGKYPERKWLDLLAESLLLNFVKGNPTVIKELLGRWEGPLPEVLEGPKGGPVEFHVSYGDRPGRKPKATTSEAD